jgi:hypothetical protein
VKTQLFQFESETEIMIYNNFNFEMKFRYRIMSKFRELLGEVVDPIDERCGCPASVVEDL